MASIAKLAIQISTDTRQMSAGLQNAQKQLKSFEVSAKQANSGLQVFAAGLGFGTANAAAAKVFHTIRVGLQFAEREASKLQDRMAEIGLISKDQTLTSVWKEFGETIGAIALPAVTSLAKELKAFTSDLAGLTGADAFLDQLKEAEATAKRMAEAAKQEEERRNGIRKAVAEATKEHERMNDRARDLIQSLRTPGEILNDGARELGALLSENLISIEQAERAAARLAKDFQDATKVSKEIAKRESNPALERGTSAEFSARQEAAFQAKQQAEAARRMAEEQAEANRLLQQIIDAIDNQPKVLLSRGKLK